MSFFSEVPPEPPRPQHAQPEWMAPPDGELGGWVAMQIELARSSEHLVLLGPLRAHPTGVEISVEILSRSVHLGMTHRLHLSGDGALRFGVRYSDGRSTSSSPSSLFWPSGKSPTGPVLIPRGGGGGGGHYIQRMWLWPLPTEGDLEFFMKWDFEGFDERMQVLDGDAIRAGAARAEHLWDPLSEEERRASELQVMEAMATLASASHTVDFSVGTKNGPEPSTAPPAD